MQVSCRYILAGTLLSAASVALLVLGFPSAGLTAALPESTYECELLKKEYPFVGMTFNVKSDTPLVSSVTPGSPALISGIRAGDVVVAYNDVKVRTYSEIISAIGKLKIGDSLTLAVLRGGQERKFNVNIDRKPVGFTYIDCALSDLESSSIDEKIYWLTKSADLGYVNAMMILGDIYSKEEPENYNEAIKWFSKAATLGNVDAQLILGMYYYYGESGNRNREEAVKWFRLAAEQGAVDAQITLGLMYSTGDGVRRDYAEAVKWVQLAADQGLPKAKCTLGVMYNYGLGVGKDPEKAFALFEDAAGAGDASAKYHLALFYMQGDVVAKNQTIAAELLSDAANGGSLEARALRDSLRR